jgi:hypothetical protein
MASIAILPVAVTLSAVYLYTALTKKRRQNDRRATTESEAEAIMAEIAAQEAIPNYSVPAERQRVQEAEMARRGHRVALVGTRPLTSMLRDVNIDYWDRVNWDDTHHSDIMKDVWHREEMDTNDVYLGNPKFIRMVTLPIVHPQLLQRDSGV